MLSRLQHRRPRRGVIQPGARWRWAPSNSKTHWNAEALGRAAAQGQSARTRLCHMQNGARSRGHHSTQSPRRQRWRTPSRRRPGFSQSYGSALPTSFLGSSRSWTVGREVSSTKGTKLREVQPAGPHPPVDGRSGHDRHRAAAVAPTACAAGRATGRTRAKACCGHFRNGLKAKDAPRSTKAYFTNDAQAGFTFSNYAVQFFEPTPFLLAPTRMEE